MQKEAFYTAVRQLDLPADQFVIVGSGLLCALGLRAVDDIDLVVAPKIFHHLQHDPEWRRRELPNGRWFIASGPYEAGMDWQVADQLLDLAALQEDQQIIDGLPFVSDKWLIAWKTANNRPKDQADLSILRRYYSSA